MIILNGVQVNIIQTIGTCIERYSTKNKKPIQQLKDGVVINEFASAVDAEKQYGFNRPSISQCCNDIIKSYKGFQFRFKEK